MLLMSMNDPVFKDLFSSVQFLLVLSSFVLNWREKKMKFILWYPCVTLAPADIGWVLLSFDVKGKKLQGSEESDPRSAHKHRVVSNSVPLV